MIISNSHPSLAIPIPAIAPARAHTSAGQAWKHPCDTSPLQAFTNSLFFILFHNLGDAAKWLSSKTIASCCLTIGVIAPFFAYGAGGYYFFKHCSKRTIFTVWYCVTDSTVHFLFPVQRFMWFISHVCFPCFILLNCVWMIFTTCCSRQIDTWWSTICHITEDPPLSFSLLLVPKEQAGVSLVLISFQETLSNVHISVSCQICSCNPVFSQ